jgi:hypothetical protein
MLKMKLLAAVCLSGVVLGSIGIAGPASAHGPGGGYGGYGMMGPGYGMGPGMMGPGYGMGPGMMGPGYGMGPGMMGPGYGMGPGMMGPGYSMGPGMMGPGYGRGPGYGMWGTQREELTVDDVRANLERWINWQGNPRLKLGSVKEDGEDAIVAEIVTKDGSLVDRMRIDRSTGVMRRVE